MPQLFAYRHPRWGRLFIIVMAVDPGEALDLLKERYPDADPSGWELSQVCGKVGAKIFTMTPPV